ncbi:class F sortase [Streptomyces sp. NPDC020490]|uniref:class F sortase n=1 Tax=Streptomyces sp. NPDC020490 TaxID=3365078 RepID=UPI0037BCA446
MTPLARRAFLTSTAAVLLAGCGGPGPAKVSPEGTAGTGRTGSAAAGHASAGSAPVRLRIPAIGVDTPVLRLGLAADGTVQVPPITAHDRAGWYRHSPAPGQTGPSVILGHVTVGAYGDGVFRHLAELRRGDRIAVRLADGGTVRFAVTAVRTVAKADFPTDDVYGNVDRPELRLVTCGGPRSGDGYRDNVIVFAAPAPSAAGER